MMAMITPAVAATMASTRNGSWEYQRVAPTNRLNRRNREGSAGQAVQHGKEPVDQLLLVEHMVDSGLALHRRVEFRVLLRVFELDDERRRESVLACQILELRDFANGVVVGVLAIEEPHRLDVVALLDFLA